MAWVAVLGAKCAETEDSTPSSTMPSTARFRAFKQQRNAPKSLF